MKMSIFNTQSRNTSLEEGCIWFATYLRKFKAIYNMEEIIEVRKGILTFLFVYCFPKIFFGIPQLSFQKQTPALKQMVQHQAEGFDLLCKISPFQV